MTGSRFADRQNIAHPPARRLHSDAAYRALKAATADALDDCGGAARFAERTRGSDDTLRNYARHDFPGFAPADVIADLETRGRPHITEVLARLAGYRLMPLAENLPGSGAVHDALAEAGQFITEAAKALADGRIDRAEAPRLLSELRQTSRAIAVAEAFLMAEFPHLEGDAS